jgi:predicted DNA-binding transcriptional regulator YafY
MRADRLLALLLLLQSRGRMTAAELSRRLEVSERTVYRDLSALGTAGVPVYAERGPGGGCGLMDGYRTNLTGLTEDEARSLFMAGSLKPLADLGLSVAAEGALLKLLAALPSRYRDDAERARQRLHLDPAGWDQAEEEVPHLRTIQRAVWYDRRLLLTYRKGNGQVVERRIDPLGLVAKSSIWYLVARQSGEMRVFRVSRTLAAVLLDEPSERPEDFDLQTYWERWRDDFKASLPRYPVTVRVSPKLVTVLPRVYGERMRSLVGQAGPPDGEGWQTLSVTFESLEVARMELLSFGTLVEVLEPEELRASLANLATSVAEFYAGRRTVTSEGETTSLTSGTDTERQ